MRTGHIIPSPALLGRCRQSEQFSEETAKALWRYLMHDWGDVTQAEKNANDRALFHKMRLAARYKTKEENILITTDESRFTTLISLEFER